MPIVSSFKSDWDFQGYYKYNDDKNETYWFVFLEQGLLVHKHRCVGEREFNLHQVPIRVDKEYGLMSWSKNKTCWMQVGDSIKYAYTDYIGDRELLGDT